MFKAETAFSVHKYNPLSKTVFSVFKT